MTLRIGSLFSGIGGLELGVEAATGGRVVWQVERDAWCRKVLARHWPDAARFDDVCTVGPELAAVDLICGGPPCQPASVAGKREGMEDERWLWPELDRIVGVVGPRFVFVENPTGLFTLHGGRAWGGILGAMAARGYDAVWDVFRASDVGAPHRRERLFCLAYARGVRDAQPNRGIGHVGGQTLDVAYAERGRRPFAGVDGDVGAPGQGCDGARRTQAVSFAGGGDGGESASIGGPTQSRLGGDPHGLPCGLDGHRWPAGRGEAQHPWEPPRVSTGAPERRHRLRALGNAVVPQVAALALRTLAARGGVAL